MNLVCNDPRMSSGGRMMYNWVTTNEFTNDIAFSANATQYEYGQTVHFKIEADADSQFIGDFLAVQVEFTGPNGEAMGQFHDLSEDLVYTPGCSSGIYSDTDNGAFDGSSHFCWTPHNDGTLMTRGNATFKLVWGNGPGGDDPLAGVMQVSDPHLYMKTLQLWDPDHWNPTPPTPSPAPPPVTDACMLSSVATARPGGHSFKRGPVAIQHLDVETGGGAQSFPSNRCVRCRVDFKGTCRSAKVECPGVPGAPVVERLWRNSDSCEGEPTRTAVVPDGDVTCPGPSMTSPWALDLDRLVAKIRKDFPSEFPNDETAKATIEEYRRMLHLVQQHPEHPIVPSRQVDLVWHSHILDTEAYRRDSLRLFGQHLHHAPSFGGKEEKQLLVQQQQAMFQRYHSVFDQPPPEDVWPTATLHEQATDDWPDEKSPDCCSADCVKPNCQSCVGCNAVDCGYYLPNHLDNHGKAKLMLSPEQHAGYVPTKQPQELTQAKCLEGCYKCSVSPKGLDMALSWSIVDDYIYFKHHFKGEAWYALGLNNVSDMGFADYQLSMVTRNYSGVKDLYKFDSGAGYPCWDVLHQCSADHTIAGTKDVEDDEIVRGDGSTTSYWNRKLVTPDFKDFDIANGSVVALFAHGAQDHFTYHGDNFASCEVNFFNGNNTC